MPGKTHGDRLLELEKALPYALAQLETTGKAIDALNQAERNTQEGVADLRRAYETTIALLQKEIEDLKKWKDESKKEKEERTRRAWAFGPNALGAVINVLLAAGVAYMVAAKH